MDVSVVFANNDRGGTNSMKIWFLILSLVDCIVCPTEKPSIHYSIEDAAMEIGRYKNIKQVDLFEFDPTTRTIKKSPPHIRYGAQMTDIKTGVQKLSRHG